jgi:hypothetical protein
VTASAIVLMPLLGWAKLRLGDRLGSDATGGEGIQSVMCAGQAAAALVALIGASAGVGVIDPLAALLVAAIATIESVEFWRGEQDDCCVPTGFATPSADDCCTPAATAALSVRSEPDNCPHVAARAARPGLPLLTAVDSKEQSDPRAAARARTARVRGSGCLAIVGVSESRSSPARPRRRRPPR